MKCLNFGKMYNISDMQNVVFMQVYQNKMALGTVSTISAICTAFFFQLLYKTLFYVMRMISFLTLKSSVKVMVSLQ